MQKSAQGAIEYLLIIGAAILVVAIVILAVTGVLSGGQSQTDTGEQSVNDSLRALRVGGIGYRIDVNLGDYATGNAGYVPFPVPNNVECKNPTNNVRFDCFYTPSLAYLIIDGQKVAEFDITGINGYYDHNESKVFTYYFKGDTSVKHNLVLQFNDCWAGYAKTGYSYEYPVGTIINIPSNPAVDAGLYVLGRNGKKCSDNDVAGGTLCTVCNDYKLWDKNLRFYGLKITNSDGKETSFPAKEYWSNPIADLNFQ
ncbi:MAG: hypothetical protein AABW59_01370 [archaeon]